MTAAGTGLGSTRISADGPVDLPWLHPEWEDGVRTITRENAGQFYGLI